MNDESPQGPIPNGNEPIEPEVVEPARDLERAVERLLPRHNRNRFDSRRCTARSRDGNQCRNAAAPGQFVCHMHGAKAPLSLMRARERLQIMLEPALEIIHRALQLAPPCPHCGRSDSDKDYVVIKTALSILDRSGLGPMMKVEMSQREDDAPWTYWVTDDELAIAIDIMHAAQSRMVHGDPEWEPQKQTGETT